MYSRYAQLKRWQVDLVDTHESEVGGFKEIIFQINGRDVYSYLKYESGAHRVQRVPVTESSGRLHTSTATVAVLPEAEEVDIDIKDEDLRIDIFHAGGHGGQKCKQSCHRSARDSSIYRNSGRVPGRKVAATQQREGAERTQSALV